MNELQQAQKDLQAMKDNHDVVASHTDHESGYGELDYIMSQISQQESYIDDLIEWGEVDHSHEIEMAWASRGVILNSEGIYV